MIDFSLSEDVAALKQRVESFVREEVIPREHDPRQDAHGPSDALRRELVERARAAGLLSPHGPKEWGGLGLGARSSSLSIDSRARGRQCDPLGPPGRRFANFFFEQFFFEIFRFWGERWSSGVRGGCR